MSRKVCLTAYHPWWFRLYVVGVYTFAYLTGLEVDDDKLHAQGRRATRYREIEPHEDQR